MSANQQFYSNMIPKNSKVINDEGQEIGVMKKDKFFKSNTSTVCCLEVEARNNIKKGDKVLFENKIYEVKQIGTYNVRLSNDENTDFTVSLRSVKPYINNPLGKQEGGSHYKDCKIQPIEYITANNLDFMQGNIVKYATRHKNKNGAEDIKKIKHYCDLILKLQYNE